jgi:hypothetical protein
MIEQGGHTKRLAMSYSRTNIRRHSFFIRTIRDWNSLPRVLVDAPSINAFKHGLDKFWENDDSRFE